MEEEDEDVQLLSSLLQSSAGMAEWRQRNPSTSTSQMSPAAVAIASLRRRHLASQPTDQLWDAAMGTVDSDSDDEEGAGEAWGHASGLVDRLINGGGPRGGGGDAEYVRADSGDGAAGVDGSPSRDPAKRALSGAHPLFAHGRVASVGDDNVDAEVIEMARELMEVFGTPFARAKRFWKTAMSALLQGAVTGLVCLAFFNGFEWGSDAWLGDAYADTMTSTRVPLGSGSWSWVFVTTGGGLAVGLLKTVPFVRFPKKVHGLFREVKDLHVEPAQAPGVVLASCISLAVGASVGPEAAMGSCGGAVGTLIGRLRGLSKREQQGEALVGMAGAMGALFPSPALGVLLLHELGIVATAPAEAQNDRHMETIVTMSISACTAWGFFFGLSNKTLLSPMLLPIAVYDVTTYHHWYLAAAGCLGVVGGIIGLTILLLLGIFRKVGQRLRVRLGRKRATIVSPMIAGLIIGMVAVALPLTLGDGAKQMKYVLMDAYNPAYDASCTPVPDKLNPNWDPAGPGHPSGPTPTLPPYNGTETLAPNVFTDDDAVVTDCSMYGVKVLLLTLFAKMFTLAVSLGLGFVGGQIFPCIFIGACAGRCVNLLVPGVPLLLSVCCMMVAVPAAFCPIPFTLLCIVVFTLSVGPQLAAPVFVSVFMSFLTACGFGVIQSLLKRQEGLAMEGWDAARAALALSRGEQLSRDLNLDRARSDDGDGVVLNMDDVLSPARGGTP